jgi:hypothetical protein
MRIFIKKIEDIDKDELYSKIKKEFLENTTKFYAADNKYDSGFFSNFVDNPKI